MKRCEEGSDKSIGALCNSQIILISASFHLGELARPISIFVAFFVRLASPMNGGFIAAPIVLAQHKEH
jgi:hypothetical protein